MPNTQAMYLVPKELLGTMTPEEFRHLKRRVVAANRAMGYWYQQIGRDLIDMIHGHVSARVPGTNTFITKGRPPERDLMSEVTLQTLIQMDISTGEKVAGEMEVGTMGEIELHTSVYKARPDVVAVCHGHSDYIMLCVRFGLNLEIFGGQDYAVYDKPEPGGISTPQRGAEMAEALGQHSIVLLKGHGYATTVSSHSDARLLSDEGPEDAIQRMINLEHVCKMTWLAFTAVGWEYEKYAFPEEVQQEQRQRGNGLSHRSRHATPGKDQTKDQCYYNAAMVKTIREAIES